MSLLDKVMFWKKEPPLDLDTSIDLSPDPTPTPGMQPIGGPPLGDPFLDNQQPMSNPSMSGLGQPMASPPMAQPSMSQPRIIESPQAIQSDSHEKSLEVISIKLDNLKVALESINQRLINIEKLASDHQQDKTRRVW